ncbi:MAG: hypothetical protein ACO1PI_13030 [Bacteroidota bacterium]
MKQFFVLILLSVLLITACKHKDEKRDAIRAEMSALEKDWAATADMVSNWGLQLKEGLKDVKLDSAATDSTSIKCLALKTDYEAATLKWEQHTRAYDAWKKMFEDGIVKTEDALKSLREFKEVVETFNTMLEEWKTRLDGCNTSAQASRLYGMFGETVYA